MYLTVILLIAALLAFLGVLLGTLAYLRMGASASLQAEANARSMHVGRIPTSGGLIVLGVSALLWICVSAIPAGLIPVILAVALLTGISWADDAMDLPPVWRFGIQVLACCLGVLAIQWIGPIFGGALPLWLDVLIAILALVWFVNLFNFMDGIDGIAGVEAISILVGYVVLSALDPDAWVTSTGPLVILAVLIAAGLAGFLFWNWHPARIFLGDAGAVPIGFLCGVVLFDLAARQSLASALILPLYFAVDASMTLLKRQMKGENVFEAHRSHLYQRAARGVGRHDPVVQRVASLNVALIGLAVVALYWPILALIAACVLLGVVMARLEELAEPFGADRDGP
ncbi:MAG: glycosyltransferase family 4 protein [Pseudomonadota bacterium]